MLWILFATIAAQTQSPPSHSIPSLGQEARRAVSTAMTGITPDAACAAGLSSEQVIQLRGLVEPAILARLEALSQSGGGENAPSSPTTQSSSSIVDELQRHSASAAGIDRSTLARFMACRDATRAGLPAAWGTLPSFASERRSLVKALAAERRAARLGRTLSSGHADTLRRVRLSPVVIEAQSRVDVGALSMSQALNQ